MCTGTFTYGMPSQTAGAKSLFVSHSLLFSSAQSIFQTLCLVSTCHARQLATILHSRPPSRECALSVTRRVSSPSDYGHPHFPPSQLLCYRAFSHYSRYISAPTSRSGSPSKADMNTMRYPRRAWGSALDGSSTQEVFGTSEPAVKRTHTSPTANESHQKLRGEDDLSTSADTSPPIFPSFVQTSVPQPVLQLLDCRAESSQSVPRFYTDSTSETAQATPAANSPPADYMEDSHADPLPHNVKAPCRTEKSESPEIQPG
jgi:hypothetical protein